MGHSLEQTVAATMARYRMLDRGDAVLAAVSGGPDSVALLHVLRRLRDRWSFDLSVAHLNHRLRGRASDEDAAFVARLASKLGLRCTVEAEDVRAVRRKRRVSLETAAREVRYAFLERAAADHGARKIATGHTADDQAETILMRLVRGAGPGGASGIPPVRDGRVIRPLVEVTRREVEAYLHAHRWTARVDASNKEAAHTRNRIRHHLLPYLQKEYNPEIISALCRFGDVLRAETAYLDQETDSIFARAVIEAEECRVVCDAAVLRETAPALRRRVLRRVVSMLSDCADALTFDPIERAEALLCSGRPGQLLTLPGGLVIERRRKTLFARAGSAEPFAVPMTVPGATCLPGGGYRIETRILKPGDTPRKGSGHRVLFDADIMRHPLVLRSRNPGDRFAPTGMTGTKTLKAMFNEQDIPRLERDGVPLLVSGDDVLWIVGYRTSRRGRVTPQTKRVLMAERVRNGTR